jgi:ABC-type bacteriocin/lantibiotic exporter with double-glycine peptidase domain
VAAEIIILLVIGSVEKIVVGLETLYDVLTAVEKIGQITDLETETTNEPSNDICYNNISLDAENIKYKFPDSHDFILNHINLKIANEEKILLEGDNGSGKTTFMRILCGLIEPTSGSFFINDDTYRKIDLEQYRSQIGTILSGETPFEGTILENITFKNPNITQDQIKWAIDSVKLGSFIKSLPEGLDTKIFPEGRQLSSSDAQKILLARCIISKPKVLFFEEALDKMDNKVAQEIIDFLTAKENKWTLIVASKNKYWKEKCTRTITMQEGKIINDTKK